jgi:hypothetical protein
MLLHNPTSCLQHKANGTFTPSGTLEPFGCNCTNTSTLCESAQSCFWFSQGCTIGCLECSGNGSRAPNLDVCGSKMKSTNNNPSTRTLNRNARCAFFDMFLHSRMPLVLTPARFKINSSDQACDQWHSTRVPSTSYRYPRKVCRNTEGKGRLASGCLQIQPLAVTWQRPFNRPLRHGRWDNPPTNERRRVSRHAVCQAR